MAQTVKRKRRRIPPDALSFGYRILTGLFGDGRGQPRRMDDVLKRKLAIEALRWRRQEKWALDQIGAFIRASLKVDAEAAAAYEQGDDARFKALYHSAFTDAYSEGNRASLERLARHYIRDAEHYLADDK